MAMTLRYDFDPEPHRSRLREALAELRRETRRPRREPRVPLALRTDATALLRGLSATVSNASRAGRAARARRARACRRWPRATAW